MTTKIDTTEWREFELSHLCDILLSHDDLQPKKLDEGDIRLVSAGMENNGVVMYCDAPDAEMFEAGCVTVDMFGQCFWQDADFVAVSHGRVNILRFKNDVTENAGKMLAAVLNARLKSRYSFEHMCSQKRLVVETIKLPATSSGEPDWDYMEQYMSQVMEQMRPVVEELHNLESTLSLHALDVSGWKEFKVGDLFDIRPTKNYGLKNSELFAGEGDIRVVVNSAQNNGVGGYVGLESTEPGNIVTFSDTTDANGIFIQDEPFVGYSHVQGMHCKDDGVSFAALQFFATAFKVKAMTMGFDYQNKFRRDVASEIVIKLPVTSDGKPDWDTMAEIMRGYTDLVRDVAHVLAALGR